MLVVVSVEGMLIVDYFEDYLAFYLHKIKVFPTIPVIWSVVVVLAVL